MKSYKNKKEKRKKEITPQCQVFLKDEDPVLSLRSLPEVLPFLIQSPLSKTHC